MKTPKPASSGYHRYLLAFLILILTTGNFSALYGQDLEQEADSVKTGFALGKMRMENPESIVSKYTYDPGLDRYIYSESVGNFDISYPIILSPQEYLELVRKEGIKSYFKEKLMQ